MAGSRHGSSGNNMAATRAARVSEQLHQLLAQLVRTEVGVPRGKLVTLTGVHLTADYAYATVWFSVLPDDPDSLQAVQAVLQGAAGSLRGLVGRKLRIHTSPELRFTHDSTTRDGMAMSQLIAEANARRAEDDGEA